MSDTDKTRPWRVRKEEHKVVRPRMSTDSQDYRTYKWRLGELRCGCPMCNDQDGRKEQARKERYAGRREARDAERE